MAEPIFRPMAAPQTESGIPRAMGTALFLHRLQQQLKPPAQRQAVANGHPIIHAPIIVRAARPSHKSSTQLY